MPEDPAEPAPPAASGRSAWRRLARLAAKAQRQGFLANLLEDAERGRTLRLPVGGVLFDFSRQKITPEVLGALLDLAKERHWVARREALFAGAPVNATEGRAALHTALRAPASRQPPATGEAVVRSRQRLLDFAESIRRGDRTGHWGDALTHVVHIGIGGSQLGPQLVTEALGGAGQPLKPLYVANIDGQAIGAALAAVNPETTMFIIASKTFSTLETLANAAAARSWFLERTDCQDALPRHFFAATANVEAAAEFGLPPDSIFPLWDWVGGRFSLWSSIGLPIALCLGETAFKALLAGAHAMDRHFQEAPAHGNAPLLAALIDIWNYNFLGADQHLILPYDHRLRRLPAYLQQLITESNGKRTRRDGAEVGTHTAPAVWGGEGTNGQHAFHQMLHQGTRPFTADFILTAKPRHGCNEQHRWLLANGIGQGEAMALGWRSDNPHQAALGNHGTNTLVLDQLNPHNLGALLAFFEHRVFCQGVIWDINSFDQWGVEFGKRLAKRIYHQLGDGAALPQDDATRALVAHLKALNGKAENHDPSGQ